MKHLKLIILILTLSLLWVMPSYAMDGGHRNGNKQFNSWRMNRDDRREQRRNNWNNMQERWQDGWGDMRERRQDRRERWNDQWNSRGHNRSRSSFGNFGNGQRR